MNEYVLIISIGPVQGFIAAARRSRDLNPEQDLQADSDLSVGNKIQVLVTAKDSEQVKQIAHIAKQAAKKRFVEVAEQAKKSLSASALRDSIWNTQIDDYVEAQAAWVVITQERGYAAACDLAGSVLAARKATRDFSPSALSATDSRFMLPKSSLDGARETVLQEEKSLSGTSRRKLGLSESEQLDCAGIAKRLGGNTDQFTPFSRIAAHSWLKTLNDDELAILRKVYEPLIALDLATRVSGNNGLYKTLPYDAQYCYAFRLEAAIRDNKNEANCSDVLQKLLDTLKPLWRKYGQPCAYGVLLLADGDRMGELLDKAKDKKIHQTITQALSAFAASVKTTVQQYEGHAIYAGGDDVLAILWNLWVISVSLPKKLKKWLKVMPMINQNSEMR